MKSITLKSYPKGTPTPEDFAIVETEKPSLSKDGTFLLKISYASVDPYMRGRMKPSRESYVPPFKLNEPISGFLVGEVVETKNDKFPVGSIVSATGEYSEYIVLSESPMVSKLNIDQSMVSHAIGILGMPGMTAYFGLLDICAPKEGETLVVSGAAGAVGGYVAQLGKMHGCKVIGIAGSDEKIKLIKEEFGCDAGINYKTDNVQEKLKEFAPKGVDMYFDNVGGDITDAVFGVLKVGGRVSVCGSISAYNKEEQDVGPRQWFAIISKGLTVKGFIVTREYGHRWSEGVQAMTKWVVEGKIKGKQTVSEGIDKLPEAFINLFTGANIGKQVVKF